MKATLNIHSSRDVKEPYFDAVETDGNGNLRITGNVTVQGAGGGTSAIDGTPFAGGVSSGTPLMAEDPTSGELLIAQLAPGTRKLAVSASVTSTPVTSSTCSAAAPATVGTGSMQAIAGNVGRVKLVLQNVGTTVLYILLGAGTASASNFTFVLPAGGTAKDGGSPVYIDTMWTGAVQWASSQAGGVGVANECT